MENRDFSFYMAVHHAVFYVYQENSKCCEGDKN